MVAGMLADLRIALLGGTAGIGFAAARMATEQGAEVVVAGRGAEGLERASRELPAARVMRCDAGNEDDVREFFAAAGELHHVFTTAGGPYYAPFDQMDLDEARAAIDVRLRTMLFVARHAAPRLNPTGSLTYMGTTGARRPAPGLAVVGATNAAAETLVRGLAVELGPIRVNLIAAGFVDTSLSARLLGDRIEERRDELRQTLPARHVVQPEDVASVALHLMTNPAITGATIDVDGGEALL
jgi:NAD(P)-dependent dehydrogenase (short-subunit alcohol dehydrogenase family)